MNRLSKSPAVVDCKIVRIFGNSSIQEVEYISPPLGSSFSHVICSDNSTLTTMMQTEAHIFFRIGLILSCCSIGSRDHNVKKFRTPYWRMREHIEQKWAIRAETPQINESANNRCVNEAVLSHPTLAEVPVNIRQAGTNQINHPTNP